MDRIIEHIERLLFQHDCVIIPDFGGFVLQSVPVVYTGTDHSFIPARKEIVFNPTLTHNDGLLMESYMQEYSIDFNKAQQLVRKDVFGMREYLEDYSELALGSIGCFVREDRRLIFVPDAGSGALFSTPSYGLPVFHFLPLSSHRLVITSGSKTVLDSAVAVSSTLKIEPRNKNAVYSIPITRTFLRTVAVAAAAVVLFFLVSPPVGDVNRSSYSASFVPQEIMPKKTPEELVSSAFSASNNIREAEAVVSEKASSEVNKKPEENVKAETASEPEKPKSTETEAKAEAKAEVKAKAKTNTVKATSATPEAGKPYYVVIGSFETRKQAENYIRRLKSPDVAKTAGILIRDGRVRVYAQQFQTENAATAYMNNIRLNPLHKQAWTYELK
ncbi:MAG: SPOR domain-containing protein [Tannerella sp.]|jgi:hypothetical protein|nr:SPOR domain-containing protein [Tannerella sp.]